MHILILNSEFPPTGGGAGTASAQIARSLVAQGQQVSVLTAGHGGLPAEEHWEGVRIIRLPARRRHLHRSTTLEQLIFMASASVIGLFWVLKLKPDAVLAFFGAPNGVAAWFWSFFKRLPYLVSLRGGDVPGFRPYDFSRQHQLLKPLLRRVWRRASAVVANSQGLRALGLEFEPDTPIAVIPNGVDLDQFTTTERRWQPPRLLFVGRTVYQKGLDVLLGALGSLKTLGWELDIVGDGPQLPQLRADVAALGLRTRVRFLGWQDRAELPALMAGANLFLNPSRHEGMPNAVLEAMASGLPVIATQIAGNEELVQPGQNGLLVPAENVEALRAALAELVPDAERRQAMGSRSRKIVEADYSWGRVAAAYLVLLQKATG